MAKVGEVPFSLTRTGPDVEEKKHMKNLWRGAMRSDLVFAAMAQVSNRYMLTKLAAKATRKLHRPNARIEDTTAPLGVNGTFE